MEHEYLLTYTRLGLNCYEWFDTLEDMEEFIKTICKVRDYPVIEKIHVRDANTLN